MTKLSSRAFPYGAMVALVMSAPGLAASQNAPSHACASVADPGERLACYDRTFPPTPGARANVLDLEAQRKQAIEEFGFNKQQLSERTPEPLREIEPDRIESIVKAVVERGDEERLVTLENGQAWVLTEATSRGRLNAGDKVMIREAALGTYMLVTPKRIALRAKRLR